MSNAERAAKYGISRKLFRRMVKGGDVTPGPRDDLAAVIRAKLSLDEQLSVSQLLALIKNQQLFRELGRHNEKAREQVGLLGYVEAGAAPGHVTDHITGAANGDTDSVQIVMHWLKTTLLLGPVRHHWVVTRLLICRWPDLKRADYTRAWKALENVREHPDFRGWHSSKPVGNQNPVFYHQPARIYDL